MLAEGGSRVPAFSVSAVLAREKPKPVRSGSQPATQSQLAVHAQQQVASHADTRHKGEGKPGTAAIANMVRQVASKANVPQRRRRANCRDTSSAQLHYDDLAQVL